MQMNSACAPRTEASSAEDVFTDRELADGWANCFDLSRQLATEDPLPRSADA